MNRYGQMARQHWTRWLPETVVAIPDPESFFVNLGDQVAQQIADLTAMMAGEDPPGETYLGKTVRLHTARLTAEAEILRAEVFLPPIAETGEPPPDPPWTPLLEDPADPVWQQDLTRLAETDPR